MRAIVFDIGCHKGNILAKFVKSLEKNRVPYRIYAFEADPVTFSAVRKRFASNSNIEIFNCAITQRHGRVKLFRTKKLPKGGGQGNSLYSDKINVGDKFVEVDGIPFSEIVVRYPKRDSDIYVIKTNIEGAEYDLIKDMHKHGLFGLFDVFLGAKAIWTRDMNKAPSLRGRIPEAKAILRQHCVKIHDPAQINLAAKVRKVARAKSIE